MMSFIEGSEFAGDNFVNLSSWVFRDGMVALGDAMVDVLSCLRAGEEAAHEELLRLLLLPALVALGLWANIGILEVCCRAEFLRVIDV